MERRRAERMLTSRHSPAFWKLSYTVASMANAGNETAVKRAPNTFYVLGTA